jgi:hypothetical protein
MVCVTYHFVVILDAFRLPLLAVGTRSRIFVGQEVFFGSCHDSSGFLVHSQTDGYVTKHPQRGGTCRSPGLCRAVGYTTAVSFLEMSGTVVT